MIRLRSTVVLVLTLGLAGCGSQAERQLAANEKSEQQQVDQGFDLQKKELKNKHDIYTKDIEAARKTFNAGADEARKKFDAELTSSEKRLDAEREAEKTTIEKSHDMNLDQLKAEEKSGQQR
jgi:hypothetical protein